MPRERKAKFTKSRPIITVEIIGTQKFEEFVKGLEVEDVGAGVTKTPPPLGVHVYPMKIKAEYDLEIPILTPTHVREFKSLNDSIFIYQS